MKWILTIFASVSLLMSGCSTDARDDLRTQGAPGPLSEKVYSLSEMGLPIQMKFPREMLESNTPEIEYNSSFGQTEIKIGERFHIAISQDDLSIRQIKSDLNSDQLFTYSFLDCGEDQLFYQAMLPTGESYYFHFAASLSLDGERYLVRTDPISEFTKRDIELLIEAVNSIELEEPKVEGGKEV